MKKIYIVFSMILIATFISCSNQNYYEDMEELDPPIQIEMNIISDKVWVTHELKLNDNEILYYSPRSFKMESEVYLNEEENYFIYTIKPSIFQNQYRIATDEDLKEIFD